MTETNPSLRPPPPSDGNKFLHKLFAIMGAGLVGGVLLFGTIAYVNAPSPGSPPGSPLVRVAVSDLPARYGFLWSGDLRRYNALLRVSKPEAELFVNTLTFGKHYMVFQPDEAVYVQTRDDDADCIRGAVGDLGCYWVRKGVVP